MKKNTKTDNSQNHAHSKARKYAPELIIEPMPHFPFQPSHKDEPEASNFDVTESMLTGSGLFNESTAGYMPPEDTPDLLPDYFTVKHAIAYMIMNIQQISSEFGFNDYVDAEHDLIGWSGIDDQMTARETNARVILWTHHLKPREVKPAIYALLSIAKENMSDVEIRDLVEHLHKVAESYEDCAGNVMRFIRYLDCFFVEMLEPDSTEVFYSSAVIHPTTQSDPKHWTVLHDIFTLMLYFNVLRDGKIDDNDKFNFLIYFSDWVLEIGEEKNALNGGNHERMFDLLDQVDHELFSSPESMEPNLSRVAKSHANLVRHFEIGTFDPEVWENTLYALYRTTYSLVYLTDCQKCRIKEYILFWNQFLDLSKLIEMVEYHFEDGLSVFSRIDAPNFKHRS